MWSFFARDPLRDFQYDFDKTNSSSAGIWRLHDGTRRGTGEEATIFVLADESRLDLGKANAKKLKTLRHPNVLKYLDSAESEKCVYIATEKVIPLKEYLRQCSGSGKKRDLILCWGLHQILSALSFVEKNGSSHWNLSQLSIFVTRGGEWKLGGFELTPDSSSVVPTSKPFDFRLPVEPPEFEAKPELRRTSKTSSYDTWCFGAFMKEVFGSKIPKQCSPVITRLMAESPGARPSLSEVLEMCRRPGGYFDEARVKSLRDLETLSTASKDDAQTILGALQKQIDELPEDVCRFKILPALMNAHEFGSAGVGALSTIFKYARMLEAKDYTAVVLPFVVRLFKSQDRPTRLRLLQNMDQFAPHLSAPAVNSDIFPNLVLGFQDTNPTIREHTIRALITLAPKLNPNNLNVEAMRHLARLQTRDEEGGIRTNTTICLGKLAQHLTPDTRRKVLIPAFSRSLKDPFPPARSAGILALSACQGYFYLHEVARGVLPALVPLTVDPEKQVRDEAFKAINGFVGKLERVSNDPSLKEGLEADVNAAVGKDASTASGWAGWAMSALSSNLIKHIGNRKKSKGETGASGDTSEVKSEGDKDSLESPRAKPEIAENEEQDDEDDGDGWEGMDDDDVGAMSSSPAAAATPSAAGGDWGWGNEWSQAPEEAASATVKDDEDLFAAFEKQTKPASSLPKSRERPAAKTNSATEKTADSWDSWEDGDGEWKELDDSSTRRKPAPQRRQPGTSSGERQPRLGTKLGAKKL